MIGVRKGLEIAVDNQSRTGIEENLWRLGLKVKFQIRAIKTGPVLGMGVTVLLSGIGIKAVTQEDLSFKSLVQVETLAKSAKHANNVFLGITKKKGGMMDPGRCRVMFDHRGQIIAKPPQSAGYSTDIAEEDAIEIGMLTKNKNHFAFAGPITNAKNAVCSSYAFLRRPFKTCISP